MQAILIISTIINAGFGIYHYKEENYKLAMLNAFIVGYTLPAILFP